MSMDFGITLVSFGFAGALLLGIIFSLELGRRFGKRRLLSDPEGARAGLGAVEGSLFGLLGLLVAFTFNGAAARFDHRRDLIVEEANAVSTAWSRLDVLPVPAQPALRDLFRRYLDARLEIYRQLPDLTAAKAALASSIALQQDIWNAATAVCGTEAGRGTAMLALPALNAMFDITSIRTAAAMYHPPAVIFALLFVLSLCCSLLTGYGMASARERSWVHMLGFAVIMAAAVYVILDLEHPRLGLIRVDAADQPLIELRNNLK